MRIAPLLLSTLLFMAGFAAADGTSSGPPPSCSADANHSCPPPSGEPPCSSAGTNATQREACYHQYCMDHPDWCQHYCQQNPGAPICPRPQPVKQPCPTAPPPPSSSNGSNPPPPCMPPAPCSYHPETDDGSFANLTALRGDFVRFKDFKAVAGGLSFSTYTVGGQATLDRVVLADGTSTVPAVFTHPHLLVACDTGVKVGLMVHDDPNGLIEFKGDAGSLTLTFPAGIKVAQTRGDGVPESTNTKITYADGRVAILHADHIQWIGQDATVSGFAAFLVPPNAAPMAGKDSQLGISLRDAALKNHLGAEVIIRGPGSAAVRQGDLPVQILPYDDVQVKVNQTHQGVATPDNRIIITLSANLTTGRVIPIAVDPAILPAARQGRLDLHYYDLINGKPVEVLFHKAASLAEILDPANGSSQPEYWVVVDPDGTVNVLVKIPHWSDHVVTLASLGELVQPSALVGIAAGVVGTLVAAVSLLTPRRRRDGL